LNSFSFIHLCAFYGMRLNHTVIANENYVVHKIIIIIIIIVKPLWLRRRVLNVIYVYRLKRHSCCLCLSIGQYIAESHYAQLVVFMCDLKFKNLLPNLRRVYFREIDTWFCIKCMLLFCTSYTCSQRMSINYRLID